MAEGHRHWQVFSAVRGFVRFSNDGLRYAPPILRWLGRYEKMAERHRHWPGFSAVRGFVRFSNDGLRYAPPILRWLAVVYSPEYDIMGNMLRAVVDTNVLIAARRSRAGASNALLRAVGEEKFAMLASVPLFFEYEAVLCRAEHLLASRLTRLQVMGFLNYLAGLIDPVKLHYLWRPQLGDVADEMVLETAINGKANWIVTFNTRHFEPATRFGIGVIRPDEAMRRIL